MQYIHIAIQSFFKLLFVWGPSLGFHSHEKLFLCEIFSHISFSYVYVFSVSLWKLTPAKPEIDRDLKWQRAAPGAQEVLLNSQNEQTGNIPPFL